MTNFKEKVDKEFDELWLGDKNLVYDPADEEQIKSFINQKMLELLEEVEGEVQKQSLHKFTGMYAEFARGGFDTAVNETLNIINTYKEELNDK